MSDYRSTPVSAEAIPVLAIADPLMAEVRGSGVVAAPALASPAPVFVASAHPASPQLWSQLSVPACASSPGHESISGLDWRL